MIIFSQVNIVIYFASLAITRPLAREPEEFGRRTEQTTTLALDRVLGLKVVKTS
jgi:hypothetical protein